MASVFDRVESERQENESLAAEYRQHLDSLAWQISDCQRQADEAASGADEMDELLAKVRKAFTAEKKRLQALSKAKREESSELQEQYDQLQGEYAEFERKSSITLEDVVSQMVEDKFLEMLRDSQEVS